MINHGRFEMQILLFAGCLLLTGVALANSTPEVTNIVALQRPGTHLVDIAYDLLDADGDLMTISAYLSVDGGATYPIACLTVVGDVGPGIASAPGRNITWDAWTDYPDFSGSQCRIKIEADDGFRLVPEGFVQIPAGTFVMGSPVTEPGRNVSELQHTVTLSRDIFMQMTETTQAEYLAVTGSNPSYNYNLANPVESINWYQAVAYCNAKSLLDGLTPAYEGGGTSWTWNQAADGWRLPTEAEWEYACRAGTQTIFNIGDCIHSYSDANYNGNMQYASCPYGYYLGGTTAVGSFPANAWGLLDMHGNVSEWCWDWLATDFYAEGQIDPVGPGTGSYGPVIRGGGYGNLMGYCRSAYRGGYPAGNAGGSVGFRIVRTVF